MKYEVKDVVCDYGVFEDGELKLILNSHANALKIVEILKTDQSIPNAATVFQEGNISIPGIDLKKSNRAEYGALMKLKRYEDTGYSPDEIDILLGEKNNPLSEDQKLRQQPTTNMATIISHSPYCTPEFCNSLVDDKCDPLGCRKAIEKWLNSTVDNKKKE